MGRRIRWLGVIMVACLGLVVVAAGEHPAREGQAAADLAVQPPGRGERYVNPRGRSLAADGTVLAKSVPTPAGTNRTDYPYHYVRQYPQGPLYAGITGYDSALYYGTAGIED